MKKTFVEQVAVDESLSQLILDEAQRRGVSRSAVVRDSLDHWFGRDLEAEQRKDTPKQNWGRKV
jgi:hypothetical protein